MIKQGKYINDKEVQIKNYKLSPKEKKEKRDKQLRFDKVKKGKRNEK